MNIKFEGTEKELFELSDCIKRAKEESNGGDRREDIDYLNFEDLVKPEMIDYARHIWREAVVASSYNVDDDIGFAAAIASYCSKEVHDLIYNG